MSRSAAVGGTSLNCDLYATENETRAKRRLPERYAALLCGTNESSLALGW